MEAGIDGVPIPFATGTTPAVYHAALYYGGTLVGLWSSVLALLSM